MTEPTPATSEDLRGLPLARDLDDAQLAELARVARVEVVGEGTVVLRQGDAASELRVVLSGRVALSLGVAGQGEALVTPLSPGDLMGFSALLPESRWVASARATKPARMLVISRDDLLQLCERDHELGYRVMRNALAAVSQRLHDTRVQLLDIFGHGPLDRA
jgi:CRP/FNR family transcriptional regulator, cyclic AMP receptor protein